MKTLYLTKSGGTTDLSNYYTKAQVDALTWLESDITDLDKYTQAEVDAILAARPRKNILMNGDFSVWQRGTSFAGVSSNQYSADRWKYVPSTDAVVTLGRVQSASNLRPFTNILQLDVTTADTSIAAGQFAGFVYFIEGYDVDHLQQGTSAAETVTLSFWHAHTKTGTHSGSFRNDANDRTYVFEYTQTATNTWEQSEVTLTLDTSGTWATGSDMGLKLHFCAAVGSTYSTTAGSWGAGNYLGSTNQVNNFDSVSNFMRFGNVQLELGSEKTDFDKRTVAEEMNRCQRYYNFINGNVVAYGHMQSSTSCQAFVNLPTRMRATPTLTATASDFRVRTGTVNLTASAVAVGTLEATGCNVTFTVTGATQYAPAAVKDAVGGGLEFSAELG